MRCYFDYNASAPMKREVKEYIRKVMDITGNPSSIHTSGRKSKNILETSRKNIASLLNCDTRNIIFTSGATEANNLALSGYKNKIISSIEHESIRNQKNTIMVNVDENGCINLEMLENVLKSLKKNEKNIISVMYANNEIGVIQPIKQIGQIVREHRAQNKSSKLLFHCDAVQALGRVPLDVKSLGVDLMSISGHKMYGPKGIGALYVRKGRPRIRLEAQIHGGGHERNMRSGTLPVHQIVGLGKAAELAKNDLENGAIERVRRLRDRLWAGLQENLDELYLNGSWEHRLPNNLNVSFAYVEGEAMMMAIKQIACSSGSACTSASLEPSYVLRHMGVDVELAHTSIRFGIGRFNTEEEIDSALSIIIEKVQGLRDMSPLYEMVKEGIDLKSIDWVAH